ncbi:MAG: hypothetical protein IJX28_01465 [Clostridia bacterium]|nr:hypothetical protein [Clostridia bacterium]
MAEYDVLHFDYTKIKNHDAMVQRLKKYQAAFSRAMERDSFLNQLNTEESGRLFAVFFECHIVAAQARGEISLAVDPDTREASVLIVTEIVSLSNTSAMLFSAAIAEAKQFVIDAVVEENVPKSLILLVYQLS